MGVIRRKPEIRYKDPDEIRKLPAIQEAILDAASRSLKTGGIMVSYNPFYHKQRKERDK